MASGCVIWGSNTTRRQLVALGLVNSKGCSDWAVFGKTDKGWETQDRYINAYMWTVDRFNEAHQSSHILC